MCGAMVAQPVWELPLWDRQLTNRHRQRAKQAGETEEQQPPLLRLLLRLVLRLVLRLSLSHLLWSPRICNGLGKGISRGRSNGGSNSTSDGGSNEGIHGLNNGGAARLGVSRFGSTAAEIGTDKQALPTGETIRGN